MSVVKFDLKNEKYYLRDLVNSNLNYEYFITF